MVNGSQNTEYKSPPAGPAGQILVCTPGKREYRSNLKMPCSVKRFHWAVLVAVVTMSMIRAGCTSYNPPSTPPATIQPQAPGAPTVTIQNFAFSPATITVPRGTTVTWVNQDSASHTIVDDAKGPVAQGSLFTSSSLASGAVYSFKFDNPGTYSYHCSIHPAMKATVIVT